MAMEIATSAPAPITSPEINIILSPAKTKTHKKNMIQVSNTKKPLFFDVNLAKDEAKGKMVQKAKASFTTLASSSPLCNILRKSDKFDSLVPPVTNGKTP
ncbi:PREDICTED: uncharacterized protein At2g34160-like [Brassica oleracea var. oleracea]|uniref:uncharacterized protein At2g34160-like n=1 Tax=Brassica oleracea var. oleracea TaxID=109376 RepID=UPI0006A6D610|nr:PREDICTED: uncharacterized protein At2g34160-like [Brassica oleracea var. oleracea]